eukprot:Gregarina_sp_Poly_1__11332@NODE_94_length_14661_cov_203_748664_g81_i0_p10_GENE_NODE_94_length_14661_cov_203_748664_g81_i0NODE_94_length_14661_cov_203_748664_g81_i0_p10_ORF_typecomplete_len133_score2_13_NODE_94_length_14661_cov_203_748664_g81_i091429540
MQALYSCTENGAIYVVSLSPAPDNRFVRTMRIQEVGLFFPRAAVWHVCRMQSHLPLALTRSRMLNSLPDRFGLACTRLGDREISALFRLCIDSSVGTGCNRWDEFDQLLYRYCEVHVAERHVCPRITAFEHT